MKGFITILLSGFSFFLLAQEPVHLTFKDTRVINSHSTEMIPKGKLDFRVAHRFGDVGGNAGGWNNFYGLESASDVLIGFEYGLGDNIMIGVNRTKGSAELKQNVNGLAKIKLMQQEYDGNKPFSVAILGVSSISTMPKSGSPGVLSFFEKPAHRLSYHVSAIFSRKFSQYFSLQFNGAWTYRNLVGDTDKNDLGSLGVAFRLQVTKSIGILGDVVYPFSEIRTTDENYYFPVGFGIEWDTGGGHVFQMNLTNSTGISETDFIPYTRSNFLEGEFRFGFTISRLFTL